MPKVGYVSAGMQPGCMFLSLSQFEGVSLQTSLAHLKSELTGKNP